ncbi:unnamed protein product [Meloidogyne enterolobii]|uniref:Uncharacterized protein n=1 Tax=Meloidogyne enterolobii TaxID=390850 RepID=A0ACB0Z3R8_MELEN
MERNLTDIFFRFYARQFIFDSSDLFKNGIGGSTYDKIVEVDLEQVRAKGEIRRARLFSNARTEGFDCGDEIGKAFDEFLEVGDKRALRMENRKNYILKEMKKLKVNFG